MADVTIYHNPRCSKSRGALEILKERGIDAEVIEYLESPPSRDALARCIALLSDAPGELVRHDKRFAELGLDENAYDTEETVIALLLEHPELMQRPIVIRGEHAVIARPSERVIELLGE